MDIIDRLKLFVMNNIILEKELIKLEDDGFQIDHKTTLKEDTEVDIELFEYDIIKSGKKMSDFYILYYCIENTIRRFISERLEEENGPNWWESCVPDTVKTEVNRRKDREKNSVMSIRSEDPLTYTTFGELINIFNHNWDSFSDTIRSQQAMERVLSQLNQVRGVIAHSCELNDDEIKRFELSIKDWLRIQS